MATADIFQLNHRMTWNGEELLNTYFYERLDPSLTAVDLNAAFIAHVLPKVKAIQVTRVLTQEVKSFSLGNLGDFAETPAVGGGTWGDVDALPVFNAIGYTLKTTTRAIRPGSKRIAGVPEEASENGVIVLAGYITAMEALRVALDDEIGTDPNFFRPVIVKRIKTAVPGTTPVKYKYTLPGPGDTAQSSPLGAVLTSVIVTHQVSRGN